MANDAKALENISSTWMSRTIKATYVAASLGKRSARMLVTRALGDTPADETPHAELMALRLEEMKGLMMKLGQMVSYIDGAMPPATQQVLRRLQSNSKPLAYDAIRDVIREEFGCEVGEVFEALEPEPIAAASLGQVHRGVVQGRPVAVKIQYPNISAAVQVDLKNLRRIGFVTLLGSAADAGELVGELQDRMNDECNYLQEAAFQRTLRTLFSDQPHIQIPPIIETHCRERVMTSSFIEARGFYEFLDTAPAETRDRAGLTICEFVFRSIFEFGLFNGDPHPGNYLFHDDGRVCFLDFGCVRAFTADFVDCWKKMVLASLRDDRDAFRHAFPCCGFGDSPKIDLDYQWEVMEYLHRPMKTDTFAYTHDYAAQSYDLLLWKNPNLRHLKMPPEWLLINRLQWGMNSVLAHLGATGDFGAIMRRYVEGPTRVVGRPPPLEPIDTQSLAPAPPREPSGR